MFSVPYDKSCGSLVLTLLSLAQIDIVHAGVALDPVTNFCRRIGHSCQFMRIVFSRSITYQQLAVVKNNTLYINGGLETYVDFGANGQQDWNTITSGISEWTRGVCDSDTNTGHC